MLKRNSYGLHVQVWAYANLGYDPGALMDAVAQSSESRMREFSPQNISNILWAYAKLGTSPHTSFPSITLFSTMAVAELQADALLGIDLQSESCLQADSRLQQLYLLSCGPAGWKFYREL